MLHVRVVLTSGYTFTGNIPDITPGELIDRMGEPDKYSGVELFGESDQEVLAWIEISHVAAIEFNPDFDLPIPPEFP